MTAKNLFTKFLHAAGYKFVNIGSSLGGVDADTPPSLAVLMLIGDGGTEYHLGEREEPFVFDKEGNFKS